MRVCFYNVTASFIPGGLETYCWEVGRAMARRGHDVTIVAGDRGGPRHDEAKLVQFPFRIEQSWPKFGTRFRRLMERLSFARGGGLDHLVEAGYDAVIINKPFDFPVLWQARRRGMKARTLFRSGGTDFFLGDRMFAGAVDHWASTSLYNARQIEGRYGRKVRVIHNGVDTDRFHPHPRQPEIAGLPKDARVIVSLGRLVGWKGLHIIVESMTGLPPDVHYLVIGEGPEREALQRQATNLGVSARIHFAGRVPHAELPRWLSLGDIFVQPSIGEEAFGISVVEAMACGLPVLASDNGGMREIVLPGATGQLLVPGNVAAWRAALNDLLKENSVRLAAGEAARLRAIDHFTWAANAATVESMLMGQ
ncbi:MAG: glycosyltransferase family 4 protein [Sterolibacteriaceae bacterium MAG5]|nr:glycosyltransferase family 4 protein [Candidatus Nitricoxidireducens bremensis]